MSNYFTIFRNVIDSVLKTSLIFKYADDSKVFAKVKSNYDYIRTDLNQIQEWSSKWKMGINKDKCHALHFGKENTQLTYKFDDQDQGPHTNAFDRTPIFKLVNIQYPDDSGYRMVHLSLNRNLITRRPFDIQTSLV